MINCTPDKVHIICLGVWMAASSLLPILGFVLPFFTRNCTEHHLGSTNDCGTRTVEDQHALSKVCSAYLWPLSIALASNTLALIAAVASSVGLLTWLCLQWDKGNKAGFQLLLIIGESLMAAFWLFLLVVWGLMAIVMNVSHCEGSDYTLANDGWSYGSGFKLFVAWWCLHSVVLLVSASILTVQVIAGSSWSGSSSDRTIVTVFHGDVVKPWRSERQDRLNNGSARTLYHQTSSEAADTIVDTQCMKRGGSHCAVGSGIYFALSKEDTDRKCRNSGVILAADVNVGRTKDVGNTDKKFTFTELSREGYDSVRLTCFNGGDEIIVYNWDQVKNIRAVAWR